MGPAAASLAFTKAARPGDRDGSLARTLDETSQTVAVRRCLSFPSVPGVRHRSYTRRMIINMWPRDRYAGPGGGLYAGPGGGEYTGPGGGRSTGPGGGLYAGPGGGLYAGPGGGLYAGPGGGLYTGPGGGLYTGPGGGLYTGPGGGLYAGPGGGLYAGPSSAPYRSNLPPMDVFLVYLREQGYDDFVVMLQRFL
ncbi:hypothetical protein GCM10023195_63710 [Actinoallomurus liliacearum]|uniref:Uncharacterized protein n=2 Tax=Actinoallomurus TaxID=667113 RepID=A0ABP8TWG0_9ACTN